MADAGLKLSRYDRLGRAACLVVGEKAEAPSGAG